MEYAQRIGARIARLRTEKHLTQGQLAQAAGVPRDALARWEAGGGLPGRAELTALARPLGTTAAALLNADEDEPDEAPVGFLTFPRTEQAWRAQARCMRGSGPRTAYALAALCCTVCAALSRACLFGSVRMACTGFFLAAAAFCLWGCAVYPFPLLRRAVPRPQAPAGAVLGTVRLYGGPGNLPLAERRRSAAPAAELRPLCTAAGCSAVCRRTGFFQHKRTLLCRRGRRRLVHGGARLRCFAGNDPCSLYRGRPHFGR